MPRRKQADLGLPTAFQDRPPRKDGTTEGVNLSQLTEWFRCRYRWHLSNRRHIARREVHPAMDLGSAVHAAIAAVFRCHAEFSKPALTAAKLKKLRAALQEGLKTYRKEWVEEHGVESNGDVTAQLDEIQAKAAVLAWRAIEKLDLARWEVIWLDDVPLIEQKLSMPFLDGVPFYGTKDLVAKDRKEGGIWVLDWKVREALQPVENEEVDLQIPAYQNLLQHHGIVTTGGIKLQIRAEEPKIPSRNKDGSMSRQRIATTWEVYEAELIKHGLDPKDYAEMRQKLDVEFFRLDKIYRNQASLVLIWEKVILPMARLFVKSKSQVRNMNSWNCRGCWAREFCLAELLGEDTDFLLETNFIDLDDPRARMILRPEDFSFEP